ncbi:MAG TPA: hypothetical protein VF881_17415 [Polyangiaceae bacterium]
MTIARVAVTLAMGAASLVLCARAGADPSAQEKAAAEALFQQGTELMAQKQFAAACQKFEGSQQLDPALGTLLRLADCDDRLGKSASAWATFREAASLARTRGEAERERIAVERAADLEKRLSRLELKLDPKNISAGLEVRINGATAPRATWDTPVPVDPGRQRIEVSAPGRLPWSANLEIAEGPTVRIVEVPALAPKPVDLARAASDRSAGARDDGSSALRTAGYVTAGLGLMVLGGSAFLSYKAYDRNRDSLAECRSDDANLCTQQGKDLRDQAKQLASAATLTLAIGGALVTSGVVVYWFGRPGRPGSTAAEPRVQVSVGTLTGGAGVRATGTW